MGITYPQYNVDQKVIDMILDLIETVKKNNFPEDKLAKITYRPLRPEEIDQTLSVATRHYETLAFATGVGEESILTGAAGNVPQVVTGSVYLIYGWIVMEDTTNFLALTAVANVKVEGVIRNEIMPKLANLADNNILLTLDQTVIMTENTHFEVVIKNAGKGATGVFFPLGVRIGPESQLNVS